MFRFTIRDMLWLTLLVATLLGMGLAWQKDREDCQRARAELHLTTIRLTTAEQNLEDLRRGLTQLALLREAVVSAEADRFLREHIARQSASRTEPSR